MGEVWNFTSTHTGNSQCHEARYKTCWYFRTINKLKSSVTGKVHHIKASTDCKMTNMVYVIKCSKCAIQYVGETKNALHIQLNDHWLDIKNQHPEKPVAKHFNSIGHSLDNLLIFVVENIHREDSMFHKAKESYWIRLLWSLAPEGLNLDP